MAHICSVTETAPPGSELTTEPTATARRRKPGQVLTCGWCDARITVGAVGRLPKWCSSSCRHRAWEAKRAADRGLVAVRVVDRTIAVEVPVPVVQRLEVPINPRGAGWALALHELAKQLDTGRIYDRDLPALLHAVDELVTSLSRRPAAPPLRRRP